MCHTKVFTIQHIVTYLVSCGWHDVS